MQITSVPRDNINELQHVQSADNFVKKWDSIFTTCNDKSSIRMNMVVKSKTILEFILSLCRKGLAVNYCEMVISAQYVCE